VRGVPGNWYPYRDSTYGAGRGSLIARMGFNVSHLRFVQMWGGLHRIPGAQKRGTGGTLNVEGNRHWDRSTLWHVNHAG
jgi:hypothetical protein